MKRFMMLVASIAFMCAGCSTTPDADDAKSYSVKGGNQVLEVKADSPVAVELVSKLSTGFSWKLDLPLPDGVTLEGESVKTSGEQKAGADDMQVFRFRVKKGEYTLTFKYAEHWKRKPDYRETCTVKIIAK